MGGGKEKRKRKGVTIKVFPSTYVHITVYTHAWRFVHTVEMHTQETFIHCVLVLRK